MEKTMLERASMERHLCWKSLLQELHSGPRRTSLGRMSSGRLYPRQGSSSLCRLLGITHPALSFSDGSMPRENGKGKTYS